MIDRPRLTLERLDIRRMPGIDPGFSIDGLCPGINVICGPNASGKTSLTRAVSTLLWPKSGAGMRAVLSGRFALDGGSWLVGYDSGVPSCQRDGQEADVPTHDSADGIDRYLLALHDLLWADNQNFAEAILRESTGGYDVGQAMGALQYAEKPSAQIRLKQQLDRSRESERSARSQQESFRQQERELEELREAQLRAREAGKRAGAIERALDVQRAVAQLGDAARILETFPGILESLSGNELDELQRLRERQAAAVLAVEQEREAIARACDRRGATGLAAAPSHGLTATLRTRCAELQVAATDLRLSTEKLVAAEAAVATARQAIGPDADDMRLATLDAVQFNGLAEIVSQSRDAHLTLSTLSSIAGWVPPTPSSGLGLTSAHDLAMGVRCLNRWLRAGYAEPAVAAAGPQGSPALVLVVAGLAIVEALLLGVLAQPAFFVLLPIGIALLAFGLRKQTPAAPTPTPVADRGAALRSDYEQLELPSPVRWELAAVESLVNDLSRRLTTIEVENATRQRFQYVHDQRPAAVSYAESIDARVAGFSRQFGIPTVTDVVALHTLANAISSWQSESGRANAAGAARAEAQSRFDTILRLINADLQSFGYAAATMQSEAGGLIDDLVRREQEWNDALTEERRGNQRIADPLQPQLGRSLDDLHAFFARVALDLDDEHGLRLLLERLPSYRDATRAVERATLELERAQAALGGAAQLASHAALDLDAELSVAQAEVAMLEATGNAIVTIETQIDGAKRGSDLEAALATEQAAADELREAREAAGSLAAGWTLGEFVKGRTRDVDRPRVFHRARDLFAKITQGRYVLEFDGSDPPRFRARDSTTGAGHALDELSSGTRLQLLLAVRVAFVEQQERGPMLPLILDETLGNSDEHRARAIIDATVQIASEGRQVLYLTAQHDEVRKWQSILTDRPDVAFKLVDLAQVRGLSDWERLPLADPQPWPMPVVPEPNGHNREHYGQLLHVPGIDLTAADSGGLHLWHLIDDSSALHALLSLQIETWGQLRTLSEFGGINLLVATPDILERCRARAQVIGSIAESWRIGRGRPIDREVLRDSDAVSDVFIDRVARLAESLEGDAVALIEALEFGQVPRFQHSFRTRLTEYLQEHGYIDPTQPLSLADVRARVLAGAAHDLATGLLTPEWVNMTLMTLWSSGDAAPFVGAVAPSRPAP